MKLLIQIMTVVLFLGIGYSCQQKSPSTESKTSDSMAVTQINPEADSAISKNSTAETKSGVNSEKNVSVSNSSTVNIYNFYVTNRCPSCIAIEDATTKTLNTYFSKEMKEGRIKRSIVNVDDDANKAIIEKYEVFGSGLLIVKSLKGKETLVDMTGDGFKYAKNKEDKFIEVLKKQVEVFLR